MESLTTIPKKEKGTSGLFFGKIEMFSKEDIGRNVPALLQPLEVIDAPHIQSAKNIKDVPLVYMDGDQSLKFGPLDLR